MARVDFLVCFQILTEMFRAFTLFGMTLSVILSDITFTKCYIPFILKAYYGLSNVFFASTEIIMISILHANFICIVPSFSCS